MEPKFSSVVLEPKTNDDGDGKNNNVIIIIMATKLIDYWLCARH